LFNATKENCSSIYDVLKFKRALRYMDESRPFGEAYGPAADRDEAIASAHQVYWSLMKFDRDSVNAINFDILALITNDEDGKTIPEKLQALKKIFRPDARNELPMLAFIQSCDTIYKRLRYFRASVSNSSVIDAVLENMVNWLFYFVLSLVVMEIMDFDPWTLIVSATSLLVSVSFALGPSVSQFVEVRSQSLSTSGIQVLFICSIKLKYFSLLMLTGFVNDCCSTTFRSWRSDHYSRSRVTRQAINE
jgi:hypothetical protein